MRELADLNCPEAMIKNNFLVVTDFFKKKNLPSYQTQGYQVAFHIKFFIPQIIKTISTC